MLFVCRALAYSAYHAVISRTCLLACRFFDPPFARGGLKFRPGQCHWELNVFMAVNLSTLCVIVGFFGLLARSVSADYLLRHRPGIVIRLSVVDPDCYPIGGYQVSYMLDSLNIAQSNPDLISIPASAIPVSGQVPIYIALPEAYMNGEATVNLDGRYFHACRIRLSKETNGFIRGRVYDDGGQPLEGVAFYTNSNPNPRPGISVSDKGGFFEVLTLRARGEKVWLHGARRGYQPIVLRAEGFGPRLKLEMVAIKSEKSKAVNRAF